MAEEAAEELKKSEGVSTQAVRRITKEDSVEGIDEEESLLRAHSGRC